MTVADRGVPLGDLARAVTGIRLDGDPRTIITSITVDSREVAPGSLFVALRGRVSDGHRFAAVAAERGASALLVEEPIETDVPQLVADDSRAVLASVAAAFYADPAVALRSIGVTGTDGKTTTSHLLSHILTQAGRRVGIIGSLGATAMGRDLDCPSSLTTPLAHHVQGLLADMVASGAQDVIIEASSMGLAEHRLDAIPFATAVVTNITPEHVEQHDGMDAYVQAKTGLVDRVAATGSLIVGNGDDASVRELLAGAGEARILTFGIDAAGVDVRADQIDLSRQGSTFRLCTAEGDGLVHLQVPGRFNIANAVAAAATALGLGVSLPSVIAALGTAPPVVGRMVMVDEGQTFAVYVDYAHTLAAMRTVLEHLRSQHPDGRLIAVFGTGLVADYWKRPLMAEALVRHSDLVVLTASDHTYEDPDVVIGHYASGAVAAGAVLGRDVLCEPDRRAAIATAVGAARPGDVVAILGKGHEPSIVIRGRRQPWSEVAETRAAVRAVLSPSR